MSTAYKFSNPSGIYFMSIAIVEWVDVFSRKEYIEIVLESLKYCQKEKGLIIYAWCVVGEKIPDLVSGNVNYVIYQYGEDDQFVHRYEYDEDNRIREVYTSTDRYIWDKEAEYAYYQHGNLARVELGQYNVQNLDYTYTLQGWIKGVNMPYEGDPGKNGLPPSKVPKDALAYTLGYFKDDYKAIGAGIPHYDTRDQLWARNTEVNAHDGLFNGNISWMVTDLPSVGQAANNRAKGMQAMLYKYDQLNRITKARSLTNYSPGNGFTARSASPAAYDVDYSYDPNGNLLTLLRRDQNAGVLSDFNYEYYSGTNRLKKVEDIKGVEEVYFPDKTYNENPLVADGKYYERINVQGPANLPANHTADLKATEYILLKDGFTAAYGSNFTAEIIPQSEVPVPDYDNNYIYDEIGNLVADKNEGIENICWTTYGKVREVIKKDSTRISFRYDGTGNRIEKRVTNPDTVFVTTYVRDASGNVMATYKDSTLIEQPIYGSSRLGMYKGGRMQAHRTLGSKSYELSNHLGNVLAVVTDNIQMSADSAWATVVSTSDYYPFGLNMEGRSWNDSTYRYGFNGKEKDPVGMGGGGSTYDYGFRIYNPVIARFLSVDPLAPDYPWYTPYQFAGNSPIVFIDLDGLEEAEPPKHNGRTIVRMTTEYSLTLGAQASAKLGLGLSIVPIRVKLASYKEIKDFDFVTGELINMEMDGEYPFDGKGLLIENSASLKINSFEVKAKNSFKVDNEAEFIYGTDRQEVAAKMPQLNTDLLNLDPNISYEQNGNGEKKIDLSTKKTYSLSLVVGVEVIVKSEILTVSSEETSNP